MCNQEYNYWIAYYNEKARLEAQANKNAGKKSGVADREFKRTMGSQSQ